MIKCLPVLLIVSFISSPLIRSQQGQTESANSVLKSNSYSDSTLVYLPISKFTYAGDKRFTISGDQPRLTTEIKPVTASIIGGVTLTSVIALHIHQRNAWWSGARAPFHFQEDWISALQVDKCGHAFGGFLLSYGMDEALKTSGVDYNSSAIYGSVFGLAYQTYVEMEDGFAKDWGFSPSDWYFDVIGPAFYLAQHYVPALQNITPKWQYVPTEWTTKANINRPKTIIDDYNSTTFWYSLNINNMLPDDLKKYWIPWLNIAIGYGADSDLKPSSLGPPDQQNIRRFTIGLDYNLVKLLPEGGSFWNWFRQTLNYIKFPAPALQFSNGNVKFYLMYPFLKKI
jgi:hypothetical protein